MMALLVFATLFPISSFAATITVDPNGNADASTIQEAIDSALDGDEIIIEPGSYEAFSINDLSLYIMGNGDPDEITIDGISVTGSNADVVLVNAQLVGEEAVRIDKGALTLESVLLSGGGNDHAEPAISVSNSRFTLNSCTIEDWTANDAIISVERSGVMFNNSHFTNNKVIFGSVIKTASSHLTINSSDFFGNGTNGEGGAISSSTGGAVWIEESRFESNYAGDLGGHLSIREAVFVVIEDSNFTEGTAENGGGAIYIDKIGRAYLQKNAFVANQTSKNGGAIYWGSGAFLQLEDTNFSGNSADMGGHLFFGSGDSAIIRSNMTTGKARFGSGIALLDGSIRVSNAQWWHNFHAETGGVIYQMGGSLYLSFAVLYGNSAETGSAISQIGGSIITEGSIIVANDGQQAIINSGQGDSTLRYSIICDNRGLTEGEVNVTDVFCADPLFANTYGGFALMSNSPAIDSFPFPKADLDGSPADMGAFGGPHSWELQDTDGDGFLFGRDCDDNNPDVNETTTEIWYDGVDQNCDGQNDFDQDQDGFKSDQFDGKDCNDTDPTIHPGAWETSWDKIDQNCDGYDNPRFTSNGEESAPMAPISSSACSSIPWSSASNAFFAAMIGLLVRRKGKA